MTEYKIPTMAEVEKLRGTNGYKMVSTFSGCGGSCLGFEMAGFDVMWANEFIPEAQNTYALNHPATILDRRDIRQVQIEEILEATGLEVGELDVFEGSPPCSAFSTAGSREKGWGEVKKYSDSKQRVDDLFFEFTRLLKGLQPKVFVAENVYGLVKGKALGYFKEIFRALQDCGYTVETKVLDGSWLGVPQARQRLILIGTRKDLPIEPAHPKPFGKQYTVREVLPQINQIKLGGKPNFFVAADRPAPTITSSDATTSPTAYLSGGGWCKANDTVVTDPETDWKIAIEGQRKFTLAELRVLCAFPADFQLTGSFAQRWERLGRSVPPLMMRAVAETVRDEILATLS